MKNKINFKNNAQNFNCLDLTKFIMAIIVVAIHTHPLEGCDNQYILFIYSFINNLAVPFFFITSGFLLGNKLSKNEKNLNNIYKGNIYKYVKLYLIWTIAYLPLALIPYITNNYTLGQSVTDYFSNLVFLGHNYNSWILWYLLSTIYSLCVIYFIQKKNPSRKKLVIICVCSILLHLLINFIANNNSFIVIKKLIITTIENGRLLTGTYFITIGMILSSKKLKSITNCSLLITGFFLTLIPNIGIFKSIAYFLSTIGLFGILSNIKLKNHVIYSYFRKSSTIIYFIHLYVWTIYYYLIFGKLTYGLYPFIWTTLISIFISIIYIIIKNKYKKSVTQQ